MRALLLLFLLFPLLELWVLLQVGDWLGGGVAFLLVIGTAIAGTMVVRRQGRTTLARARDKLNAGIMPAPEVADGMCLFMAGALLLVPGFITDALGFLLLLPPVRKRLLAQLARRFPPGPPGSSSGGHLIEGRAERID